MNEKLYVLPSSEEIVARLTVVRNDELTRRVYLAVSRSAGRELNAEGILLLLQFALDEALPKKAPPSFTSMQEYIPAWIDALVDDKQVAEAAKQSHRDFLESLGT